MPPTTLDHDRFPHIVDSILSEALRTNAASTWRAWRTTSRAFRTRLDTLVFSHLAVFPSDDADFVIIHAIPNGASSLHGGLKIDVYPPLPPSLVALARTVDVCGDIRVDHAAMLRQAFPALHTVRFRPIAGRYTDFCALSLSAQRVVVFGPHSSSTDATSGIPVTTTRPPYPQYNSALERIVVHASASFGASFVSQAVPRFGRREVVISFSHWCAPPPDRSPENQWVRSTRGADIARTLARHLHGDEAGKCTVVDVERLDPAWLGMAPLLGREEGELGGVGHGDGYRGGHDDIEPVDMREALAEEVEACLWEQVLPYGTPHDVRAEAIEEALRNLRFVTAAEFAGELTVADLEVETVE